MLAIHMEDIKIASNDLSEICKIVAFILLMPLTVTIFCVGGLTPLDALIKFSVFLIPSIVLYLIYRGFKKVSLNVTPKTKHMMITVSIAWFIIALAGSLPYFLSNTLGPLDSFFESMSGWTTTGMTMIQFPEHADRDILFYRALTQWVGGVGIIVLALVVFMRRGTFAMDYYASEVGDQRIKPRLKSTISETWKIYMVYTIACIILLYVSGVGIFDSVSHSFSALSTGGFSTHYDNVGYFNDYSNGLLIHTILIIFMIIGAISFLLHFKLFEGKYEVILRNIEFRYMLWILSAAVLITAICLYSVNYKDPIETIRDSVFQMVAAMTCTGFSTTDISLWSDVPQTLMIILMYVGGLYGSTAGGIKILRLVVIVQVIHHSLKKLVLPKSAVLRMKISGKQLKGDEIIYVFGLSSAYLMVAVLGGLMLMGSGYTGMQSMSLSLSAMGNVGLTAVSGDLLLSTNAAGLGEDLDNDFISGKLRYAFEANGFPLSENSFVRKEVAGFWRIIDGENIYVVQREKDGLEVRTENPWFRTPVIGKITLILLMWIGRLEVFPVLILFTSIIYKRKSRKI
jgi:trk system potassium uptake protein TrkH